ncbi:MAG: thymidylate synthase [Deltaproteobacteria bacterium]|nr:thymidylate synthase [Deltaproteobacteria bacterium]
MTTDSSIVPIHGENLSKAWAKAFVKCWEARGNVLAPEIVCFSVDEENNSWELETPNIRQALENHLDKLGVRSTNQSSIETVAGTIFPESIWNRCQGDRKKLFDDYDSMWPHVERCPRNRRGTYFRRLTAYGKPHDPIKVNQLKEIIEKWQDDNHCHSALQAGIFDPFQDHINSRIPGFPCLQQVVFHPHGANGAEGMTVVAFYANQLLLEKAYGNYLGLFRLGLFMAGEMGLKLRGITCVTSNLKLSDRSGKKRDCKPLMGALKKELVNAV